tara:strand:- start:1430 stop:1549 length:120 start_codon:yes stop_codon:yes gene_type:complete
MQGLQRVRVLMTKKKHDCCSCRKRAKETSQSLEDAEEEE